MHFFIYQVLLMKIKWQPFRNILNFYEVTSVSYCIGNKINDNTQLKTCLLGSIHWIQFEKFKKLM